MKRGDDSSYHDDSSSHAGKVVYTPPEFPCAFHVIEEIEENDEGKTLKGEYDIYVNEGQLKLHAEVGEDWSMTTLIRREGQSYYLFTYDSEDEKCVGEKVDEREYEYSMDEFTEMFLKKQYFDSVENGKFDGKSCKVYTEGNEDYTSNIYVDDDGYIIGETTDYHDSHGENGYKASISYKMKASPKEFVLDSDEEEGCDALAYDPPKDHYCESGASIVKASLLMIIALIVASLF